jgi:hypothetical protein
MYIAPRSPQSIGGVIDDAIRLFKASFSRCWKTALVCSALMLGLSIYMQLTLLGGLGGATPQNAVALAAAYSNPTIWLVYLVIIALSLVANLMIVASILEVSHGRDAPDALSFFGTTIAWLPGVLLATVVVAIAVSVGMVLLVLPGIYLIMRWSLWIAALADERRGSFTALSTSWRLVGGNWWRTLIIFTVVGVVTLIVVFVLGAIGGFVGASMRIDAVTGLIGSQVLQSACQVVYLPAIAATMVAVYQDLKLRKGGADLEARLGSVEATPR